MAIRRIVAPYKTKIVRAAGSEAVAKSTMALLQVIRWDPNTNTDRVDSYEFDKKQDFMVLDLLIAIKSHYDPTLSFRSSCGEGVCGSCAMNINGANSLACVTFATPHTFIGPLPNFPVTRDLVVDLRQFFHQYEFIRPFIRNENLPRYHIDSIVERYNKTAKAVYGTDTKEVQAVHDNDQKHSASEAAAFHKLLDKVVSVGDVAKTAEILRAMQTAGIEVSEESCRVALKQAASNWKLN